jgi:citrate/tricarballylate utilization protein
MLLDAGLWRDALRDAATLRQLDVGGIGCMNEDEEPTDRRRLYHHLTFYGFVLCLASTSVATLWHCLLGREAPHPWYDLPVPLGTAGGIGLLVGPACLLLIVLRATPATGVVMALFVTMAYGKFMHGPCRLLARLRHPEERRRLTKD